MGTEVALTDIKQRLTDQIKGQFADLIPHEEWESLIERETESFMKVDFPKIVKECLTEKIREIIKGEFNEPRWQSHWNGYYNEPARCVGDLIRKHSDDIVAALVGSLVQGAVQNMRSTMNY